MSPTDLDALQKDWKELGEMDPLYAVLSHGDKKFGQWNEEAFFATATDEIAYLRSHLMSVGHVLNHVHAILDFGCGVGRLSRALTPYADHVIGVDISPSMIAQAKTLNTAYPNIQFILNDRNDLTMLGETRFDLIYSSIVLQHIPSRDAVLTYIQEFVRLLSDTGVAVFQIPVSIRWLYRLRPRRVPIMFCAL